MLMPFIKLTGWQTIYRRMLAWEKMARSRSELFFLGDRNPDLPFNRTEVSTEIQKWCWQP